MEATRRDVLKIRGYHLKRLLPQKYGHCRLTNFVAKTKAMQEALAIVKDWYPTKWMYALIICGPLGSGKSHLAAAKARELVLQRDLKKAKFVKWVDAAELYGEYNTAHKAHSDRNPSDIELAIKESALLVIDDLGQEMQTEASIAFFNRVFCSRYDAIRPFIVTTNLTLEEIAKRYGERISSRFVEIADVVELQGPSVEPTQDYRVTIAQGRA